MRLIRLAMLLVWLPALGQPTPPPPGLREVVQRWVDAIGGDKAVRKARRVTLHAAATEDGIAGQVEERIDGDAWQRVTVQGARARTESCRDGIVWIKDWNGKVQQMAGRDRLDQLSESAIESLLFGGLPARLADSTEVELAGEDDAHTSTLLKFKPARGLPFDVYLDKASSLPAKIVRTPYDDAITLTPSDWRSVGGRKVPFSLHRTEGGSGTETTTIVREVVPGGGKGGPSIGRPEDGDKDYRFASGRSASAIPFNFENDHIMVQARVNGGTPIWFMLDTGAEATIVNKARMAELGVRPFGASSVNGGGNATDISFADVARLEIGGAALLNQRDGVIDLSGLERIYGMPMGGLLGYDFFSRFVVRVDYDAKTIDLIEPAGYAYSGSGASVSFILEGNCPHVTSTITVPSASPIDADLIVDAGAADTVNLTSPFVKAHRLLELARKKPAGGPNTMAGSEKEFFAQTSVRGRLGGITLGTYQLKDIPSNLMVGTKGSYASGSFSGTIGEGVLHRFNAVYDYARDVMILEPNAGFGTPFPPRKTFGATLLSDGAGYTRFTITGVRKDSPAESAGLKKDDVIVAIDGAPAATLRLADVRKLLAAEGARRAFEIKRGDETLTIETTIALVSLDDE